MKDLLEWYFAWSGPGLLWPKLSVVGFCFLDGWTKECMHTQVAFNS